MSILSFILTTAGKSDHDLLVELTTKVDLIHTLLTNHLEHHFVYSMAFLGALLSTGTALLLYIVKTRKSQVVVERQGTKEGE